MNYDIAIIGAGMAGAAAGYALAQSRGSAEGIILIERESQPGYHSTGRSAALYEPALGNATVRAFNTASGAFLRSPPNGFAERPLMSRRGELTVADASQRAELDRMLALDGIAGHVIRPISAAEAMAMVPILRPDLVAFACHEPDVMDMDVNALHQGFLRGFAAAGGKLVCNAGIERIERTGQTWRIAAGGETLQARAVVNAAGAWADEIALLAGIAQIGLQPKRRTAAILPAPDGYDIHDWPVFGVAGEPGYFKPESGKLLVSPGDATPVDPQDVQPKSSMSPSSLTGTRRKPRRVSAGWSAAGPACAPSHRTTRRCWARMPARRASGGWRVRAAMES